MLGLVVVTLLVSACGGSSSPDLPQVVTASTSAATSATSSASPASGKGTYSTKAFVVPLSVKPPSWAVGPPLRDESHIVTWTATDGSLGLRFLVPVKVYRPGAHRPSSVPSDYLAYLTSQTSAGALLTHVRSRTVGGEPATELSARSTKNLAGSLACEKPVELAVDCFGLQVDNVLRLVVVPRHGAPLLIWLRMDHLATARERASAVRAFDAALATVRFAA